MAIKLKNDASLTFLKEWGGTIFGMSSNLLRMFSKSLYIFLGIFAILLRVFSLLIEYILNFKRGFIITIKAFCVF